MPNGVQLRLLDIRIHKGTDKTTAFQGVSRFGSKAFTFQTRNVGMTIGFRKRNITSHLPI